MKLVHIVAFGIWFGVTFGQENILPPLEAFLPRIDQEHFKFEPSGQRYSLSITLPDGSKRTENGELRNPNTPEQELFVSGEIRNFIPEGLWKITYEAGKDGYTATVTYKAKEPLDIRISPTALKSIVGG